MDESDNNNLTYQIVGRSVGANDLKEADDSAGAIDNPAGENNHSNQELIVPDNQNLDLNTTDNLNYYIGVSLLSIITYMIVAYSSNVALVELVDLEIPLVIFLSLMIVFLSNKWSRLSTYLLSAIAIAIMISLNFNYSFLLMIVLFSELTVYSLNMIINNKDDYIHKI